MPHAVNLPYDKKSDENGGSDSVSAKEALQNAALSSLLGNLNLKLSEYVSKRYEKEQEWLIAEKQYAGLSDILDDKPQQALSSSFGKSIPIVNITRPKTNIATARLQDVQFPLGGDFNFSVRPTPYPELKEIAEDTEQMPGAPDGVTVGEVAQNTMAIAVAKAQRMEARIHDRFVETDYAKKARMAMEQTCRLGTGVLKAPVLANKRRKTYHPEPDSDGKNVQIVDYTPDTVPTVQWVDIRTWFPDPSSRPGISIPDAFELHQMTRNELVELADNPAFYANRISEALRSEPDVSHIADSALRSIINDNQNTKTRYPVMEYHGPLDKECMFALDLISEKEKEDPLVVIQGEVWFVGTQIIRVSAAPLEGEETIPYFVHTWEDDQTSVFGHGVPYLMRHSARVVNSAWIMLLDNAGLSAGPQIVLNKEMIQPAVASEGWSIRPMKVWFLTQYGASVKEAMQFVNVPTQQEPISNIIELALQFADIESSIPQILQGEIPSGNNTFGGVAMVMTASHIVQKKISEKWDDQITVPLVKKFYDYEMQYGEDDSLKGDYEVMAAGATGRIDAQIRSQDIERIIGMAGSNEAFMEHIDIGKAFREWVATTRVGADILRPAEEVEASRQAAMQNPPPDPVLITAEAKAKQAEAAVAKVELDKSIKPQELNLRAQVEEAKVDKENRLVIVREKEAEITLQIAQMERDLELLKAAHEDNKTQREFAADMQTTIVDNETKRLLKKADIDKFNTEIAYANKHGEGI